MKILYLAHRIPYPPNKGDKIRSYHQVRYLAERHQVDLVCLADDPADLSYRENLLKICNRVHVRLIHPLKSRLRGLLSQLQGGSISLGYFYRRALQVVVDQWLSDTTYDAIICFSSTMAEYVLRSCVIKQKTRPRLIMDFCDVDSYKWRQYADSAKFPLNRLYYTESLRIQDYEKHVHETFDATIVVSQQEADIFLQDNPADKQVAVVRNGIDWNFFRCPENSGNGPLSYHENLPTLVFTGAMDYAANVDGVVWFCKEILPLVKKDFPRVQFKIVGSKPTQTVKNLAAHEGVVVTGFVDDIRPYYSQADVCVIPLRVARGIQNKVLEAMAMNRAVVTTSAANTGVNARDGEQLLVADTAREFAAAVAGLLKRAEARALLGKNAREYVVENFDWEKNLVNFNALLRA